MRTIIIITLLCVMSSLLAIKPDKVLHFAACAGVTVTTTTLERYYGVETNRAILDGMAVSLAIGLGKEFYDASSGGKFDIGDLDADIAGIICGTVINLVLKKSSIVYKKLDIYASDSSFGFVVRL